MKIRSPFGAFLILAVFAGFLIGGWPALAARSSPQAAKEKSQSGHPALESGLPSAGAASANAASSREERRRFALQNPGDPEEGRRLFNDRKSLACASCHALTAREKSGPNLEGVGDKYSREELIRHIEEPNFFINPGYETTLVATRGGEEYVGVLKRVSKLQLRLADATGGRRNIQRRDVVERRTLSTSLMPEGLAAGLSPEEFADLIAYLSSLKRGPLPGFKGRDEVVEIPPLQTPVAFEPIHGPEHRFKNPVWLAPLPGRAGECVVLEQMEGKVWRFIRTEKGSSKELFLDLSGDVSIGSAQGLMALAFHPNYRENGKYYLKHETRRSGALHTVVVERKAAPGLMKDSGKPSRLLLSVEQPAPNHNGGCLAFGPDGFLYTAFGDGGPQRDPPGHSQNPRILHGSMLRIDVNRTSAGRPYGIPEDNPWLERHRRDPEVRPETWAIGFREPWRFCFDSLTGELWVGDVGQNDYEEVAVVQRGENHGWNVYEGFEPFSDQYRRADETYTPPVFAYSHRLGPSVTGGFVYRGDPGSSFYGVYIFGDFETRRVWGLTRKEGRLDRVREIGRAPERIASFGLDGRGEIHVVGYEGTLYRLNLAEAEFE